MNTMKILQAPTTKMKWNSDAMITNLRTISSCLLLIAASHSHADLVAYDDFNYAVANGTTIAGLNGGTGWETAYPTPGGSVTKEPGLSYASIHSSGGAMVISRNSSLTSSGRIWNQSLANGTYWYSVLVHPTADPLNSIWGRGTFVPVKTGDPLKWDYQNGLGFRLDVDMSTGALKFLATNPEEMNRGHDIIFQGGYDQTYFVLGKIEIQIGGISTNQLWVFNNNALPFSESALGVASTTTTTDQTLQASLGARVFNGPPNGGPIAYDEFRLGTSFFDVVPKPRLDIRLSQVELCWLTASNNWYQLQYRSTLTTNQWTPVTGAWIAGDGSQYCTTDAILVGTPQRFYQLSITNSPPQ